MAIKLEMLRVFQVVAEQGSLAGAANVLGRTPSAVSMMLAQFEDHLGGALFQTDRKNALSPLGVLVLAESRRANDAFARATDAIRRHVLSTAGTVRIAAVPSATVTLLPGIVARFRRERPDVRLEISDVDTASVLRRVRFDEADIGLISTASGATETGELVMADPLGIVCHHDSPLARAVADGAPPSWDLLALEPLIANPLCNLVGSDGLHDRLTGCNLSARNTTALLAFVRSGLGVTVLPETALYGQSEGLAFVAPQDPPALREIRKVQRAGEGLSPVAQTFWDLLGEGLGPALPDGEGR